MISVLLPSRDRPELCLQAINSLKENAQYPKNIEYLVYVDACDPQLDKYKKSIKDLYIGPRKEGYKDLHNKINFLCSQSIGDWLFLFNDDAKMLTKNWDKELYQLDYSYPYIINFGVAISNLFPVMSFGCYRLLGHFSQDPHNDTYLEFISKRCGIEYNIPWVAIDHFRDSLNDKTKEESYLATKTTSHHFFSKDVQYLIDNDVQVIKEYLEGKY